MNKRTKEATNEMTKEKARKDGNREVVSDVFSMLMQYPEYALDIYNALNGSHYEDPRLVEIVTLKNGISLTVRNDGSFFIGGVVNFYEHQLTHNPNIKANILREFFIERRDEVRRVTELDFTWESQEELNRIEHKADAVCELLEDLGEIPQKLQDEIYAERDLNVLSKMLKLAAKAKSIEDFQAKLEEMKCCL